jgi:hypothetical protein
LRTVLRQVLGVEYDGITGAAAHEYRWYLQLLHGFSSNA